ncbi:MAG: type B 50S ribosomal protein L31 [Chlamydiia bacterium]|nr:type B 50S ribosomal protein L31 [Chlamydiia bacterium]
MKKEGHPSYQDVLFVDTATGTKFVCGTTLQPKETEVFEGKEYPVYRVPISSASHPFFTGSQQFVDAEGRVDKFRNRYTAKKPAAPKVEEPKEDKKVAVKAKKAPAKKVAAKKKPSDS